MAIAVWNIKDDVEFTIPNSFKYIASTTRFKHLVKNYLLSTAFWLIVYM